MIKLKCLIITVISLSSFNASAANNEYCNNKYNYCLTYPDVLIPQAEPDAHDGQKFLSKDKLSELSVWASYKLFPEDTIKTQYKYYEKSNITYKLIKNDYFIISGFENGKIFYQKTSLNKETFTSYRLLYPKSKKNEFNKIIKNLKVKLVQNN